MFKTYGIYTSIKKCPKVPFYVIDFYFLVVTAFAPLQEEKKLVLPTFL